MGARGRLAPGDISGGARPRAHLIPGSERMYRLNTRVITVDVPPQDVITNDNVTLKVTAVVFFHIISPKEAVVNVEDW
jgi:regulator of protease activity HflC (stomatin/prohibitin superfamily)